MTHDDLAARRLRWQRLLGSRPGAARVLMVDHRHRGGGIYVPLGVRVLLDVAINGSGRLPAPAPRFPGGWSGKPPRYCGYACQHTRLVRNTTPLRPQLGYSPHPREDGPQITVVEEVRDDGECDNRAAGRGHRQGDGHQLVMQGHRQADGHAHRGACRAGDQPGQRRVAGTLHGSRAADPPGDEQQRDGHAARRW